jgi:hypothetical protein
LCSTFIDDLFLRKLPPHAGDELADVIMSRYEKASTLITSNREIDDWAKLLGDVVIVTPLLDRLMHHGHLLKFVVRVGASKNPLSALPRLVKPRNHRPSRHRQVRDFDPAAGGRTSRHASARSKMPAPTARCSSGGTTPFIVTATSA